MTIAPRHLAGPVYEWDLPDIGADIARLGAVWCVAPDGRELALGAFASGGRTRARLAAYQPGEWRWTIAATSESGTLAVPSPAEGSRWPGRALGMSENRRYMVQSDGTPVFFLADTDWFVTWKAGPSEWATLLDHRAEQGFSVSQVHLMPFDLSLTDVDGNAAFVDGDVTRPNEPYFARIDQYCQMAAERGIYAALFLLWGGPRPNLQAVNFTTKQAVAMIRYAVSRYACYPVIWSTSGDAPYIQELAKWEAVGDAVEESDPYGQPTTNHLSPDMNWHELFHSSKWHDFHMIQTGHHRENLPDVMNLALHYYHLSPTKAYVNGEPWYDHHPDRDHGGYGRCFDDRDERYAFWVSVLSGATMGHTYGSQGVWNWKRPGDSERDFGGPAIGPAWTEAIQHPGGAHCGLGAKWLRGLPWWELKPRPESVQLVPAPSTYAQRPAAACVPGKLWVIYIPDGDTQVIVKGIEPKPWVARWLNPRTGEESDAGFARVDSYRRYFGPVPFTAEDWVLVLRAGE